MSHVEFSIYPGSLETVYRPANLPSFDVSFPEIPADAPTGEGDDIQEPFGSDLLHASTTIFLHPNGNGTGVSNK